MLPGVPRHPFGNGTNAMLPMISMLPMILMCHRPTPEGDMAVGDTKCRYRTMDWNYLSCPPLTLFSRVLARTFHVFFKHFTLCLKLLWPELSILPVDHACHVCSSTAGTVALCQHGELYGKGCWACLSTGSWWWLRETAATEQQRSCWPCRPSEESDGHCKRVNIPPQLQVLRLQKLLCRSWWLCALWRWLPGHLSPLWKLCQHLHPHILVLLLRLDVLPAQVLDPRQVWHTLLWGRCPRREHGVWHLDVDSVTWPGRAKPPRLGRTVLRRVPAFKTRACFLNKKDFSSSDADNDCQVRVVKLEGSA